MVRPLFSTVTSKTPARLVILISGRGSNMLAIDDACKSGELNASIALVISNRPDAKGLESAAARGLETSVIDHTDYASRDEFDDALDAKIRQLTPDWIVLAGFMRILGNKIVNAWSGKMINIHPSLLPKYPGLDTHAKALSAGDTEAGASVHIVTPELDAGPVIAQVRVSIEPNDTAETLGNRVLAEEHTLYVQALKRCTATAQLD